MGRKNRHPGDQPASQEFDLFQFRHVVQAVELIQRQAIERPARATSPEKPIGQLHAIRFRKHSHRAYLVEQLRREAQEPIDGDVVGVGRLKAGREGCHGDLLRRKGSGDQWLPRFTSPRAKMLAT
jgi:hypothetical protein